MTANCSLSALDVNNVTCSGKCVQYSPLLKTADLFSSYENIHYVRLRD